MRLVKIAILFLVFLLFVFIRGFVFGFVLVLFVVTIDTEPDAIDTQLSNVDTTNSKATSAETGDAKRNSTTSPNDFEKYKFYKKSTFRFGITW